MGGAQKQTAEPFEARPSPFFPLVRAGKDFTSREQPERRQPGRPERRQPERPRRQQPERRQRAWLRKQQQPRRAWPARGWLRHRKQPREHTPERARSKNEST